jgi:hypothetical protein
VEEFVFELLQAFRFLTTTEERTKTPPVFKSIVAINLVFKSIVAINLVFKSIIAINLVYMAKSTTGQPLKDKQPYYNHKENKHIARSIVIINVDVVDPAE